MNVWALAIPLTGLFTCSNLCASATACCPRFVLNTSTDWQPLFTGDLGLLLVVLAHGSGFPLAPLFRHRGHRRTCWGVSVQNVGSSTQRALRRFLWTQPSTTPSPSLA